MRRLRRQVKYIESVATIVIAFIIACGVPGFVYPANQVALSGDAGILRSSANPTPIRVLVFSKVAQPSEGNAPVSAGIAAIRAISIAKSWHMDTTEDAGAFNPRNLSKYDVVVWNNTGGDVLSVAEQTAYENYIHRGGGYVGIHRAVAGTGATEPDWPWYERLVGARLKQYATGTPKGLIKVLSEPFVSSEHSAIKDLPRTWEHRDAWYEWVEDPFLTPNTNIYRLYPQGIYPLLTVSEKSYGGQSTTVASHTVAWCQEFEGGRALYTALGHTEESFESENFRKHLSGAIEWAAARSPNQRVRSRAPAANGLIVDLDADKGVTIEDGNRVSVWRNQVRDFPAQDFVKRDEGRPPRHYLLPPANVQGPGSGRPVLRKSLAALNGHSTLSFREAELVNLDEDALDGLTTGGGHTWFVVLAPYAQIGMGEEDMNGFIGNEQNAPFWPGFEAGLSADNTIWVMVRNGVTFGKFDANNPLIRGPRLQRNQYYVVGARLGAGVGAVKLELFVDSPTPVASGIFAVNPSANTSRLAIGQERDATDHPGFESFDGEIARVLIYKRPLSDAELANTIDALKLIYFSGLP